MGKYINPSRIEGLAKILWDITYLCWNIPVHDVQFSRASGNKILQVQLDVEDLVISDEDVTDNV